MTPDLIMSFGKRRLNHRVASILLAFLLLGSFYIFINGCTAVNVGQESITVGRHEESHCEQLCFLSFFFKKHGQIPICLWLFIWSAIILSFAFICWKGIDCWDPPRKADAQNIDFITPNLEQIRITKYQLVSDEITRYRNLEWQIGVYAWGIYYGISLFKEKHLHFSDTVFVLIVLFTAASATLFLIFCENTATRNRKQRRELEIILKLDPALQFTERAMSLGRPGFLVSMAIFLFAIWAPALIMIFFRE